MIPSSIPYVSFVIPALNEAAHIRESLGLLCRYATERGWDFEVVVVDDGSHDTTGTEAAAADHRVRVVRNKANRGKGYSLRRGMLTARGRFRLYTDADIPYRLSCLDEFLRYLDFQEFHVALGDRTLQGSTYHLQVPFVRKVASYAFSWFAHNFVVGGWRDTQCGLKGFRAEVAENLFPRCTLDRFGFDVELIYATLKNNYDIIRLPVILERNKGTSVHVMRDSLLMLRDLARIRLNAAHGRYVKPITELKLDPDIATLAGKADGAGKILNV